MDEATVDYVDGAEDMSRIADATFTIDEATLIGENGASGESDVTTGWHPIEFLLWGQDLTAPEMRLPGQRTADDYDSADNAVRRGDYLETISGLLVSDLEGLASEWAPGTDNYRSTFESDDPAASLQKILTGMIVLSGFETGGERLQAALDAGDQEVEDTWDDRAWVLPAPP